MAHPFFSHNGELLPAEQASISLNRIEYSYGFGVYESIRVSKGRAVFTEEHCERLINSASIIGLEHNFTAESVKANIHALIEKNQAIDCNIKILLIGSPSADKATLDMLCLNPLFPDRKLYKQGAKIITYNYERAFPQAKTLNMLQSYLAYREASAAGAYDALLIDRENNVREGTRTNFFGLKNRTLISPPVSKILDGVTRQKVMQVAEQLNFKLVERDIPLAELENFDSLFLTSTSSKIMPIGPPNELLNELMVGFDIFLKQQAG